MIKGSHRLPHRARSSFPRLALAAAVLAASVPFAGAQESVPLSDAELVGNPQRGVAIADEVCGECHGVAPGIYASPVDEATPFARIADTPGMTSRALQVWLTTFHPGRTMPAIILPKEDRQDIIAYILSLAEE